MVLINSDLRCPNVITLDGCSNLDAPTCQVIKLLICFLLSIAPLFMVERYTDHRFTGGLVIVQSVDDGGSGERAEIRRASGRHRRRLHLLFFAAARSLSQLESRHGTAQPSSIMSCSLVTTD